MEKVQYTHGTLLLEFWQNDGNFALAAINTNGERMERERPIPYAPFQLGVEGVHRLLYPVPSNGASSISAEMRLADRRQDEKGLELHYVHDAHGLSVLVRYETMAGCSVLRQTTSVTNAGAEPRTLTFCSASLLNGLATDGIRPWKHPEKLRLHYAHQTWHGEGQWRSCSLEDLGLYHESPHPSSNTIRFSSYGTFSTGKYLPMFVLEDRETNKVWFMQVETSSSWNVEFGFRGSWNDASGCLYACADGGSERYGNWTKTLQPGETYTSVPVAFGCVEGGFNETVRELTTYRRTKLKPADAWGPEAEFPLVYNDFMNGIWGLPTRERLEPLVASAAEAGAEIFCIDAGWFMEHVEQPTQVLGDWKAVDERFGEGGLQGMLDDIRRAGMTPGIWLELEMCHERSAVFGRPDDWFLRYNGRRIGGPDRVFFDFANGEVRDYFHRIIDGLVAMGVGYIKNDYNDYIPHAHAADGVSKDGLREGTESFYAFIDEVRARHPGLILENCGSGAMREDYAALSHFHVQSSSDQEFYDRYPSILIGSSAAVLPEQLGIWAYPYPLPFLEQHRPELVRDAAYQARMADGEETIFNLVNGCCGNMVLAGHLYAADAYNMALIREGVAVYKREREHIRRSAPVYPTGLPRIGDARGWCSFGLLDEARGRMLLAVWKRGSEEEAFDIPLARWFGADAEARLLYPAAPDAGSTSFRYYGSAGRLTVGLKGANRARLFEVAKIP